MPKDLADKIQISRSSRSIEGERRIVTILLCDVKGTTAMAETLDPEEWAESMNIAYLNNLRALPPGPNAARQSRIAEARSGFDQEIGRSS